MKREEKTHSHVLQMASTVIDELDHFHRKFSIKNPNESYLQSEPFVAHIETVDADGKKRLFLICRHRTPLSHDPMGKDTEYASYLAPLGQIVTKRIGQKHQFDVVDRKGRVWSNSFTLEAKCDFTPEKRNSQWDGINANIITEEEKTSAGSLRILLKSSENQSIEAKDSLRTRTVNYKVELPAQAILDSVQDEIFRLPFNSRVRISGAPGTGKTTVLLKRLSQKTKRDFLTDQELKLIPEGEWRDQDWILFTPSDLLKGYLEKALAKEQLPAGDEHVQVYWTFRSSILREMGVIKVLNSGFFRALGEEVSILKKNQAGDYKKFFDAFQDYYSKALEWHLEQSFRTYHEATRKKIRDLTRDNEDLLKSALEIITEAGEDILKMREAMKSSSALREANTAVGAVLKVLAGIAESQTTIEQVRPAVLYQLHRRLILQLGNLGMNLPESVPNRLQKQIDELRQTVRELAESFSVAEQLKMIPRIYADFRRESDSAKKLFTQDADQYFGRQNAAISAPEQDLLLIFILDLIRDIWSEIPADFRGIPEKIVGLMHRMRTNVCIDEVTDFSALEIACMERFAHPKRGGVTICGDLMQRITQQGINSWDDLKYFSVDYKPCNLKIGYRQTARLFEIARQLHANVTGETHMEFQSAYAAMEHDPPALLNKVRGSFQQKAEWLVDRIGEIFEICDQKLPSIAILVPDRQDVELMADSLRKLLADSAIEVDASHDGGKLGNPQRVRVFPVTAIKGLEFEAVFYIGIDLMEKIHKDLIDKYLYVGLSRARNFMGITYDSRYPKRLDCIRSLFNERSAFRETVID